MSRIDLKKTIFLILWTLFVFACGNNDEYRDILTPNRPVIEEENETSTSDSGEHNPTQIEHLESAHVTEDEDILSNSSNFQQLPLDPKNSIANANTEDELPLEFKFTTETPLLLGGTEVRTHTYQFDSMELTLKKQTLGGLFGNSEVISEKFCLNQQQNKAIADKISEFSICKISDDTQDGCIETTPWMVITFEPREFELGRRENCQDYLDLCENSKVNFDNFVNQLGLQIIGQVCN